MRPRMAKNPVTAAVVMPMATDPANRPCPRWCISSSPAPKVIGVESRNEKRAAETRSRPAARPVVMLRPERETPGTSESDWAVPITRQARHPGSRVASPRGAERSTHHNRKPNSAKVAAWIAGARSRASRCRSSRPVTAAGTDATAILSSVTRAARRACVAWAANRVSRVLGLVREQVMAALFGAGFATAAFNVAFRIPILLRELFAEGAMSSAFVPTFTEYHQKRGADEAWALGRQLM